MTLLSDLSTDEMVSCYRAADCLAHLSLNEVRLPAGRSDGLWMPDRPHSARFDAEVIADNADYVPPRDSSAVAGVLAALLSNPARQE